MAELKPPRPLIGVSGPDNGGLAAWLFTRHAVRKAGGKAIRIRPGRPVAITHLDGLIIGGGADIDPTYYGEEREYTDPRRRRTNRVWWRRLLDWCFFPVLFLLRRLLSTKQYSRIDPQRDALEQELLAQALRHNLPILGICRGAQLLNTYFGGTLHQDLREFYQEVPRYNTVLPKNFITIAPGSKLAKIMRVYRCGVNALHYQAIKDLGGELKAVAREECGIIQAIECPIHPFLLGVQWHPEYLPLHETQLLIFQALVQAAVVLRPPGDDENHHA